MTLYRVYYKEDGMTWFCYVEVSDKLGRKKAAEARRIAKEEHGINEILRVVKDC